jgi:hypothetical protein
MCLNPVSFYSICYFVKLRLWAIVAMSSHIKLIKEPTNYALMIQGLSINLLPYAKIIKEF